MRHTLPHQNQYIDLILGTLALLITFVLLELVFLAAPLALV